MKLAFVSFWRKSYKYDENIPFKNMMTRYPSKKEKFKNFCKDKNYYKYILGVDNPSKIQLQESKKDNKDCAKVIKLNGPWQAPVTTYNSNTQIAYKTVLTPFTIALDIISIPFVFIATIMAGIGMSDR